MAEHEPPPPPPSLGRAFLEGPFVRPPRTRVGWASVALAAAYVAAAGLARLGFALAAADARSRPSLQAAADVVLLALGVATAATVAIAVWRRGERSWMLGVPALIGLGALVYLLGWVVTSL
jgi:hypothetical protein